MESTIQGEKIAMSIRQDAMAHVMSILTNMYEDPEKAVLREYATNGWDSHIAAGVKRPIRITTPTEMAPFLTIKDHGLGLSVDEIRDIYSQYGASTKRDTDEQQGMLGIGCKSALAYASQFTMVAIKDGFRSVVSVSRDADGAGSMTVLEMVPTDEENGVEIQIPAKRHNDFEEKAKHLFSFWERGTVLVNGLEPERVDGLWIDDDMVITEGSQDYLVMGNIPYPVSFGVLQNKSLVVFVPIGSVTFAPSREGLSDSKLTKETIAEVKEFFAERVTEAVQREIDKCVAPWDALKMASMYRSSLYRVNQTPAYFYKGKPIPQIFKAPWYEIEREEIGPRGGKKIIKQKLQAHIVDTRASSQTLSSHNKSHQVLTNFAATALVVYGYETANFTAAMKKRLNKYCTENNVKTDHYLLCRVKFAEDWLDPSRFVSWETIKAVTLPQNGGRRTSRISGSYDMYVDTTFMSEQAASDIDISKPLYYMAPDAFIRAKGDGRRNQEHAIKLLTKYRPGCTVVILGANRVDKFCRNFPKAKEAKAEFMSIYKRTVGSISADTILAHSIQDGGYWLRRRIENLDPACIDDPALARWLRVAKTPPNKVFREKLQPFHAVLMSWDQDDRLSAAAEDPFDKYPLFDNSALSHPNHVYAYLNAAYAAGLHEVAKS